MAEKATGNTKGATAKKQLPAKTHNLDEVRKKLAPFVKAITDAYDKMEEVHGSHVLTINHKFDTAAEATGLPKSLLRKEIARIRRRIKEEAREQEMSEEEREDTEKFRDAMDGTPFGVYAAGQLAQGKTLN